MVAAPPPLARHPSAKLWAVPDILVLFLAVPTITAGRYLDPSALTGTTWLFASGLAALHLTIGFTSGPYARGHPRTSFGEVRDLTRTTGAVGLLGFALEVLSPGLLVPRSVPLMAAMCTLVGMCALRFVVRTWFATSHGENDRQPQQRRGKTAEEVQLDRHHW